MPSRTAINKQKVYTKDLASDSWVEDKTLFWTGGQSAKGTGQRSFATFIPITPDGENVGANPTEQTAIDEAKERMQFGLEEYLGITDVTFGLPNGKWILVTKLNAAAVEIPRFIGQAWSVERNFDSAAVTNSATAIGLDGLLSLYQYFGAAHMDTGGLPVHFEEAPGVFNERDRPNRSADKEDLPGVDTTYIFDYIEAIDPEGAYWEPEDVAEYTLNRLKNQVYIGTSDLVYPFFALITDDQLSLDGQDPFASQVKIREYNPNEISVWAIITQMVETGGEFTTTIVYTGTGTTSFARISVTQNG